MKKSKRIPTWNDVSLSGVALWFKAMLRANLLYHPDDDPKDVIALRTGRRLFNRAEAIKLRQITEEMFSTYGALVYEAALPAFHEALNVRPDC
jgi:hypothetical protein